MKFVLDNARYSDAIQWVYNFAKARECHQKRKVNSLYFDDVNFSSVGDNLAGVSLREKMRLRWYGRENVNSPTFEVKLRNGRLGYKKLFPIDSLSGKLLDMKIKDITRECEKELIKQKIILDKHLVSTLQVSYDREYYEIINGIRITIDQNIQFHGILPSKKLNKTLFTPYPYKVMEIKFSPEMKEDIRRLLKPLHITSTRHSKYLIGLAMLGQAVYI